MSYDINLTEEMRARVSLHKGIPRLFVNNQILVPNILMPIRGPQTEVFDSEVKRAGDFGQHLLSVVPLNDNVEETMDLVLKSNPKAIIMMRIAYPVDMRKLGFEGQNFVDQYGGEQASYSYASDKWAEFTMGKISAFIDQVQASPRARRHVFGYHVGAGSAGEWLGPYFWDGLVDCSPVNERKFRAFLEGKYSSLHALNQAWEAGYKSFDEVLVPRDLPGLEQHGAGPRFSRHEDTILTSKKDRIYIDYLEYYSDLVARRIGQFVSLIKEKTQGESVTAVFYGYHTEARMPTSGQFALNRLLALDELDIICAPVSYDDRNEGGRGASMGANASIAAHGKLWLDEADYRSPVRKAQGHSEVQGGLDTGGYCQSVEGLLEVVKRQIGKSMAWGGASWWFDMVGRGWYDFDEFWEETRRLTSLYGKFINVQEKSDPDIAIIADEGAVFVQGDSWQMGSLSGLYMRQPLYASGMSWGWYLKEDILEDRLKDSKLYIFLHPYRLSSEEVSLLREKLQGKFVMGLVGDGLTDSNDFADLFGARLAIRPRGKAHVYINDDASQYIPGLKGVMTGLENALSYKIDLDGQTDEKMDNNKDKDKNKGEDKAKDKENQLKVLGSYEDGSPAMSIDLDKKQIFCGASLFDADQLRALGKLAGGHVYLDTNDVVYASKGILVVHTVNAGVKDISFPEKADVYDVFADTWHENVDRLSAFVDKQLTKIYIYGSREEFEKNNN